jgi:carbon monoxide dehydrogenase subunit G
MELHHEFTAPVPVDDVWRALLDIERVAPCMPGASWWAPNCSTAKQTEAAGGAVPRP